MKLNILINAAPTTESAYTAYRFVETALKQGHIITQVFFYQEAVHTASRPLIPPADEPHLHTLWVDLAHTYALDLLVCVAAALRRGVIDQAQAKHPGESTVAVPFQMAGLGQLIEAMNESDRCITFN